MTSNRVDDDANHVEGSFLNEDPVDVEQGRPSSPMEDNVDDEEEQAYFRKRIAVMATAVILLLSVALVLLSLLIGERRGDNSTSNSAVEQPDNQLFGGAATNAVSLSKSHSTGSVSFMLPGLPVKGNNNVTEDGFQQCMVTPNGWTVSAVEDEYSAPYPEVDSMIPGWPGYHADVTFGLTVPSYNRTFDVEPNHTVLQDEGVIFNIETVPEALPEDARKPRLSKEEIQAAVEDEVGQFYQHLEYPPTKHIPNVTLEVLSDIAEGNLVFAGGQGFVASAMMAFAYHLPLALAPDHLWAVITSGFAYHVNQYPEELRHNFVAHEGQLELEILENSLHIGESPPAQWEELIFPRFTEEVGKNMNNTDVFNLLAQTNFTTTTPTSQAASQITLMATLKAYFRFTMVTLCGIPQIKLEGTREDWQQLIERTAQLAPFMMPNHTQGDLWITEVVLPILDEFLAAYDGNVNYCFWQTMVKFRLNRQGCVSFDFLSGWLPSLFPYLDGGGIIQANRYLRHWSEASRGDHRGPDPSQIPIQMASAPVKWDYYSVDYFLHFHAGFRGVTQEADGALAPVLGWYISHDP